MDDRPRILGTSLDILDAHRLLFRFPRRSVWGIFFVGAAAALISAFLPPTLMDNGWRMYLLVVAVSLPIFFIIVLNQAGLISQASVAFDDGEPSLASGNYTAGNVSGRIVPLVILYVTVGVGLNFLIDGNEVASWISQALLDSAAFLVLPTIVFADCSGLRAIARSLAGLRHTWRRCLIGGFGTFVLQTLPLLPISWVEEHLRDLGNIWLVIGAAILCVLWVVATFIVAMGVTGVYQTVLYRTLVGAPEIPR